MDASPGAPRISAIVTAYNVAPYIAEAVQSLLEQRGVELEIIVVNDGSTDGTAGALESFAADPRVRIIAQRNSGSSAARNAGARAARGEFLAFLDGDDVALPDRCAASVRALERRSDAALAYGATDVVDERGALLSSRRRSSRYKSGSVAKILRYRNFIPFSTITVRTCAFFELGGFDETIPSSEDWDFAFRLSRRFAVVYVGQSLARYRVRRDAKTSNVDAKEAAYLAVQRRIFINYLGLSALPRLAHACRYAGLASIHLHRGDLRSAARLTLRSLGCDPLVVLVFRYEIFDMLNRWLHLSYE